MGRPRLRTRQLRDQFLTAATAIVVEEGTGALTTRQVAAETDSSLAALNELFGGKDGLIGAIALDGFARLERRLSAREADGDPRAELLEVCRTFRGFVVEFPKLAELMFSRPVAAFGPTDSDLQVATAIRRAFTTPLAELLDRPRSSRAVVDSAVGLVALVEGLAWQELGGLLGSSPDSSERRFSTAIEIYVTGTTMVSEERAMRSRTGHWRFQPIS